MVSHVPFHALGDILIDWSHLHHLSLTSTIWKNLMKKGLDYLGHVEFQGWQKEPWSYCHSLALFGHIHPSPWCHNWVQFAACFDPQVFLHIIQSQTWGVFAWAGLFPALLLSPEKWEMQEAVIHKPNSWSRAKSTWVPALVTCIPDNLQMWGQDRNACFMKALNFWGICWRWEQ